jgi:hypothetical protein
MAREVRVAEIESEEPVNMTWHKPLNHVWSHCVTNFHHRIQKGAQATAAAPAPTIGNHGLTRVSEYMAIDPPMNVITAIMRIPMRKYLNTSADFFINLLILQYGNSVP